MSFRNKFIFLFLLFLFSCYSKNPFYGIDEEDLIPPNIFVDYPASDQVMTGTFNLIGRAKDTGGDNTVLKIEISTDNGLTWKLAGGTTDWSYTIDSLSVWGAVNADETILIRSTDTDYKHNQKIISVTYRINNTNPNVLADIRDSNDTVDYDGNTAADGYHNSAETSTLKYTWLYDSTGIKGYEVVIYNVSDSTRDIFVKDIPDPSVSTTYSGAEINPGTASQGILNSGVSNVSYQRDASNNIFFLFTAQDSKRYYITVKPYDSTGQRGPQKISMEEIVDTVVPPDILNFKINGLASGSSHKTRTVTFQWDTVTDLHTSIRYYKLDPGDGNPVVTIGGGSTNYSYTYSADGTYTAQIKAVDMPGNWSANWVVLTGFILDTGLPSDVGTISDTSADGYYNIAETNAVTYSWQNVTDLNLSGYDIQVIRINDNQMDTFTPAVPADGASTVLSNGSTTGITSVSISRTGTNIYFHFTGLDNYRYQLQIKAYDISANRSAVWAVSGSVFIDQTLPANGSVSDSGSIINTTAVPFSWTNFSDGQSGLSYYKAYCSNDNGATYSASGTRLSSLGSAELGITGLTLSDLATSAVLLGCGGVTFSDSQTVRIKITAVDTAGNESTGAVSDGITINSGTSLITITSIGSGAERIYNASELTAESNKVNYQWTHVSGSVGYDIQVIRVDDSKIKTYSNIASVSDGTTALTLDANTGITGVEFIKTGTTINFKFTPTDNHRYQISVKSYDSTGNRDPLWSNAPDVFIDLTVPVNGTVYDSGSIINTTAVPFSWTNFSDGQSGLSYYKAYCSNDNGATYSASGTRLSSLGSAELGITGLTLSDLATSAVLLGCGGVTFSDSQTVRIKITAVDTAGNESTGSISDGITINSSASLISIAENQCGVDKLCNTTEMLSPVNYQWTHVTGAVGYDIQVIRVDDSKIKTYSNIASVSDGTTALTLDANTGITNVEFIKTGTTINFKFTPTDNHRYQISVKSYDSTGNRDPLWSNAPDVFIDITSPSVPALTYINGAAVSGTLYSNTTVNSFTWSVATDAASGIDYYQISTDGGTSANGVDETGVYASRTLAAPGTYSVKVRSIDKAGNLSGWSAASISLTVNTAGPGIPTGVQVDTSSGPLYSNTAGNRIISWTAPGTVGAGIAYYQISLDDGVSVSGANETVTTGVNRNLALLNSGPYLVRVRTVDNSGNISGWSASVTVYVEDTLPGTPAGLQVAASSGPLYYNIAQNPSISWTAPSDGIGSGIAYYQISLDNGVSVNGANETITTGVNRNLALQGAGPYLIKVRAVDQSGNIGSWTSAVTVYVENTVPADPTVFRVNNSAGPLYFNTAATVGLSWTAPADGTGSGVKEYRIYNGGVLLSGSIPGTTHSINLALGASYSLTVRAVDNSGNESGNSNSVSVITENINPPDVGGLTVNGGSGTVFVQATGSSDIAWTGVTDTGGSGLKQYHIKVGSTLYTDTASPYSFNFSTPNTTYPVQIRAEDNAGNFSTNWSSIVYFVVDTVNPTAASNLKIAGKTPSSGTIYHNATGTFSVTWDAGSDALSGVQKYQLWVNGVQSGADIASNVFTASHNFAAPGTYLVKIITFDNSGWQTDSSIITLMIETTAPANPSITQPATDLYKKLSNEVAFTITEGNDVDSGTSYCNYLILEDDIPVYLGATSTSPEPVQLDTKITLTDGKTYKVSAQTVDKAGNVSAFVTSTNSIMYDITTPDISGTALTLTDTGGGIPEALKATVTWNAASDTASKVDYYILEITRVGNGNTATVKIMVNQPTNDDIVSGSEIVTDGTGTVLNGTTPVLPYVDATSITFNITLLVFASDTYNIKIKAVDRSGNDSGYSAATAPDVLID